MRNLFIFVMGAMLGASLVGQIYQYRETRITAELTKVSLDGIHQVEGHCIQKIKEIGETR
jgi:hypothetical protein